MEADLNRLHSYIGSLINETGCQSLLVGGVADHVHVVCLLSGTQTAAHLIEEIKRNSSRWIKTIAPYYSTFAWQNGYSVFSISQSVIGKTLDYVEKQSEHHKHRSFEEEYVSFLNLYKMNYDERYILSD